MYMCIYPVQYNYAIPKMIKGVIRGFIKNIDTSYTTDVAQ